MKYFWLVLLCLCVGCTHTTTPVLLSQIETLLENNPDSALVLLTRNEKTLKTVSKDYQMKYLLCLADAQNKIFSKIMPSKKIEQIVSYMENHADSFEQARAYYLLGSAYRDEGETPMALGCFQKAATLAEQVHNKRNHLFLSRIYGQISDIFDLQDLPKMSLTFALKAQKYALLGGDTLFCATSLARSLTSYQLLDKYKLSIAQGKKRLSYIKAVGILLMQL